MITTLVTGVGGGVGQGILKCLHRIRDIDIRIIAADMSSLAAGLYNADVAALVPAFDADNYINEIIELCRRNKVDYYFPGTDVELEVCSQNAVYIEEVVGTKVVVSPVNSIRIANDKYETSQFLKKNGLSHPVTYLPNEVDAESLLYPVIVKPRYGFHSIGVETIRDAGAMADCLRRRSDVVIQEKVSSETDEYTCTVVNANGKLSPPVILNRVLRSGDTYRARPVEDVRIGNYVCQIARKLNIVGSSNFQLRMDKEKPKLFEINCRFSGSTPLCAEIGMNPVEFYLKNILNIPYYPKVRYDVTIFRAWSEVIVKNDVITSLKDNKECRPLVESYGVV